MNKRDKKYVLIVIIAILVLAILCYRFKQEKINDITYNNMQHIENENQNNIEEIVNSENIADCQEVEDVVNSNQDLGLYSISAVLIDGDSGRALYEKNSEEIRAMASTTKIMTLIVALENGNPEELVTISEYAARMPDVQLNINTGEQYKLKDLMYSLMLESHNDSAVAIAEHIGGSVEGFAQMMNQKAIDIGCYSTYFITPNGLDKTQFIEVTDENGNIDSIERKHSTTSKDLARIMKYCLYESDKSKEFLEITRMGNYTFTNMQTNADGSVTNGTRNFSCNNHNAFLSMMEGALSGKTGFTSDAGYCYVGALEKDGKKLIVALLGCGWPNNKSYKWSDTRKLMEYGLGNYNYVNFDDIQIDESRIAPINVTNGQTDRINGKAVVKIKISDSDNMLIDEDKEDVMSVNTKGMLLRTDEKIDVVYHIPDELTAPIKKGDVIGDIEYQINGCTWEIKNIVSEEDVDEVNYNWCLIKVLQMFVA